MPCEANMQPVSEAIDPVQTPMRQANLVHIGSYWKTHLPTGGTTKVKTGTYTGR